MTLVTIKTWTTTSEIYYDLIGFPRVPVTGTREKSFDFDFIDFPAAVKGEEEAKLDFDVVIVGSGCGGGVCAKNLSEAGLKVLVTDKSYHYPTTHFPMDSMYGGEYLMENGGTIFSEDKSIVTVPASVFGGGGTINWSASLHTQAFVREEWAKQGLPLFTSQDFQECLDRVAERMGVSMKHINHNYSNRTLLEGARKLGYHGTDVPQNTGDSTHDCGYCTFGCAAAVKQGPAVSFLPDAAKAGAKFMQGFMVDKIIFDESSGKHTATGVIGTWTSPDRSTKRQVRISAKRVIISGGTMNSPLILMRSGLKNPQIGRNLYLHPVVTMSARFDEETRPWEGGILTAVVRDFENQDGHGHGVKLECLSMHPWSSKFVSFLTDFPLTDFNSCCIGTMDERVRLQDDGIIIQPLGWNHLPGKG